MQHGGGRCTGSPVVKTVLQCCVLIRMIFVRGRKETEQQPVRRIGLSGRVT